MKTDVLFTAIVLVGIVTLSFLLKMFIDKHNH